MWVWGEEKKWDSATLSDLFIVMNTDRDWDTQSLCLDLSSPHTQAHENTCKYCMFLNINCMCKNRYFILSLPLIFHIHITHRNQTSRWHQWTLWSPPGGQWALFSIPLLLPLPVFISLHLFWSSGVISQTKCLSAHKGRWLICFNASICQLSCLWPHSVWKGSSVSKLAFQDLQAFQHLRQERPSVGWVPSFLVDISLLTSSMCSLEEN